MSVSEVLPERVDTSPIVIQLMNVSKQYRRGQLNMSLRHETTKVLRRLVGFYSEVERHTPFYALRDVNLSIRKGETVGLIGHNGAGKTTLLRLMSGITRPTSGTITISERLASLIALNAGFNLEMTGRKNIYLNAAIFGTQPRETRALEADIVAFADIGDAIDLPVKLYSSGMQARLGFSIVIHILPEIILIDEILAVGDADFARKCIDRLLALKREGRTMVLVSHTMEWIRLLTDRTIWLEQGRIMMDGPTDVVTTTYEESTGTIPA